MTRLIFVSGGEYASTRVVVDPFPFPFPTEETGLLRREDGLGLGMLIGLLMAGLVQSRLVVEMRFLSTSNDEGYVCPRYESREMW
jgi:hypothetical protein